MPQKFGNHLWMSPEVIRYPLKVILASKINNVLNIEVYAQKGLCLLTVCPKGTCLLTGCLKGNFKQYAL